MALDDIQAGDRVRRRVDLQDTTTWRYGKVARLYLGVPNGKGERLTFYAVHWDDNPLVEDRGFMRIGLEKLPPAQPPILVSPAWMPPK